MYLIFFHGVGRGGAGWGEVAAKQLHKTLVNRPRKEQTGSHGLNIRSYILYSIYLNMHVLCRKTFINPHLG